MNKWQAFISLNWYAGLISFMFRFVAMTSEPLLAFGVIVSAADFLQQGRIMAGNAAFASAWAWCQALAIEASTGPTLAFALGAFRTGDKAKGILYSILASLLFIVGSAMLFLQLVSNVTGMSEASINPWVLYGFLVLRVIVASGILALLCTKHMRFSGLIVEAPAAQGVTIIPQAPTSLQLQAPKNGTVNGPESDGKDSKQPVFIGQFASKESTIADLLRNNPQLTVEQVAEQAGCHIRTAAKWSAKYKEQTS